MKIDKGMQSGSTTMLILKLLEKEDMYGYQMIETLEQRSNNVFTLKAGTLYPILHGLEEKSLISAYEDAAEGGRQRRYYKLTEAGRTFLAQKEQEWNVYSGAVNQVLKGAYCQFC